MDERHGWEVIRVDWVDADKMWKTVVRKNKELKTVYFPMQVSVGQIVDLYRV